MNILNQIMADKKREVYLKQKVVSVAQFENSELFNAQTLSLSKSLKNRPCGLIAEHKRRSPSKGEINCKLSVEKVVLGYETGGASGLSVLTDSVYFGGASDDLILAKASSGLPILRKEFIVDAYQIFEAKAIGADAVLLIAAALTPNEIKQFSELAQSLAMEVLLEVHNLEELERSIVPSLDMIGVNNRNLQTFEVRLETSFALSEAIPNAFVKVSESGIDNPESVKKLQKMGFDGFLIGEHFMKTNDPGESLRQFLEAVQNG